MVILRLCSKISRNFITEYFYTQKLGQIIATEISTNILTSLSEAARLVNVLVQAKFLHGSGGEMVLDIIFVH